MLSLNNFTRFTYLVSLSFNQANAFISSLTIKSRDFTNLSAFPFKNDFLTGKKVLITGGNDGLGAAITEGFIKVGADVVVIARNKEKFNQLKCDLNSESIAFIEADLADSEQIKKAGKTALDWADGTIDILVNNAGVALLDPLLSLSPEKWDKTMAINVRAPFLLAQICAPGMIEKKGGKIINITSQAGTVGLDEHGAYCASKSALDSLTRVMAKEWSKHNIQCNSIGPTVVLTEMGKKVWGGKKGEEFLKLLPLGRFAEPEEVANTVLFLCSDAANIICGQTILMEGGATKCM
mmetsp:Transcript_4024/g.5544  ORF Transcript_4024/g.5544 Transcript_4024/m.5544 type:complete len:294 (+) Transcript_4024:41-922(+)